MILTSPECRIHQQLDPEELSIHQSLFVKSLFLVDFQRHRIPFTKYHKSSPRALMPSSVCREWGHLQQHGEASLQDAVDAIPQGRRLINHGISWGFGPRMSEQRTAGLVSTNHLIPSKHVRILGSAALFSQKAESCLVWSPSGARFALMWRYMPTCEILWRNILTV